MDDAKKAENEKAKKRIKHLAIAISCCNVSDRRLFFDTCFKHLPEDKAKEVIEYLVKKYYIKAENWGKVDKWMDGCIENHYDYPPTKIAKLALHYHKVNRCMLPLFIKMAQNIKSRVSMRRMREQLKTSAKT